MSIVAELAEKFSLRLDIDAAHIGQVDISFMKVAPQESHFLNLDLRIFQPIQPIPVKIIGININNNINPPARSSKNLPAADGKRNTRTITSQINGDGLFISFKNLEACLYYLSII
tara:strand:- start:122 stop:466 length:345 start_codon:yes stop_codon:yes gene_type:complete